MLSPLVLRGVLRTGYTHPSPIQLQAIPLGRIGIDLIVQAKSGTGKTCVFSVIALESISVHNPRVQVLVLAPTREIAVQIRDVTCDIGAEMPGLSCHAFIGGIPIHQDKAKIQAGCQIAVGTPGRIHWLVDKKVMPMLALQLFIMDEVDKLLDESFSVEVHKVIKLLPYDKQVLAVSATYGQELREMLMPLMRSPQFVDCVNSEVTGEATPATPADGQEFKGGLEKGVLWLKGVRQYYCQCESAPSPSSSTASTASASFDAFSSKVHRLHELLSSLVFDQCMVFCNQAGRAEDVTKELVESGWPAAYICGALAQPERLALMTRLRSRELRVLVCTDLMARGIDIEHVNLVVNLDLPRDPPTYLHRVGRTGRFGSYGVAVTFAFETEVPLVVALGQLFKVGIDPLPDDYSAANLLPIECDGDGDGEGGDSDNGEGDACAAGIDGGNRVSSGGSGSSGSSSGGVSGNNQGGASARGSGEGGEQARRAGDGRTAELDEQARRAGGGRTAELDRTHHRTHLEAHPHCEQEQRIRAREVQSVAGCTEQHKFEAEKRGPQEGVGGNWKCPECSNINFSRREKCNKCRSARALKDKPAKIVKEPRQPQDQDQDQAQEQEQEQEQAKNVVAVAVQEVTNEVKAHDGLHAAVSTVNEPLGYAIEDFIAADSIYTSWIKAILA
jgi:ATP-dependent RNA helicase DDX20